jgi:hypothetical protein
MLHDTLKFKHSWLETLCMKTERHILGCYGGFERLHLWVFFAGDDEENAMLDAFVLDFLVA